MLQRPNTMMHIRPKFQSGLGCWGSEERFKQHLGVAELAAVPPLIGRCAPGSRSPEEEHWYLMQDMAGVNCLLRQDHLRPGIRALCHGGIGADCEL